MRVYIVNGDGFYSRMWKSLGGELVYSLDQADLVQFTGGEDVDPSFYGEENVRSHSNFDRDVDEQRLFHHAKKLGLPMVGICRGGQFLNVMSGGSMWQHVENHTRNHRVVDLETGDLYTVTSTHHQMMRMGDGGKLVCSTIHPLSGLYVSDKGYFDSIDVEPECIWYDNTKCLCFQPHPEWNGNDGTYELFKTLVKRYFGV